ncbi:disrupted in schizophrenia 1 protein isoform X4 [Mustelus asterias]
MFAGMDVVPQSPARACRLRSISSSDCGPRSPQPQKRDNCISILTGLSSCKKKLSKKPGYMRNVVEHHPPLVGVYFVSQHVENERKTCTDLSSYNNKLEGYCLNDLKHLREDKSTVLNHLAAENPTVAAFQPNMMSESILCSDSNRQWPDDCDGSCYTGINTCSKHLPTGCLQKQGAGPTQCVKEKGIDVSKPQAVTSPNKQVDDEKLPRLQPWDIDEEVNSANAFISSFSFIELSLNCNSINADGKELQQNGFVSTLQLPRAEPDLRQKDYDTGSLDADFPFLCSADSSDYSSGSSVTSGYESINTAFDQKCNSLLGKYEPILQDCLLENRMTLKLQSLILKLKKLQKEAVQEDDYEKVDKFSKKLAELKREKSSLKFQLPSYHPCIAKFLQEAKIQAQAAEQHNNAGSLRQGVEDKYSDSNLYNQHLSWSRRKQLILDRQQLQEEITDLKERLAVLEAQDNQLQTKEQSLSMAIKTATTKVFNNQKLCSNLSKKVNDIETQLPTLLEAKMLAISGREFSTAKDLDEEIKSLNSEKTRLEELISELQDLSIKNTERIAAIREDYSSLRTELEQKEGLFENNLKENVFKYMDVLEDKLHSFGSQLLEKVWEADLEACQLFVRGLQLKERSYNASEMEEFQADEDNKALEDTRTEVKDTKESAFPSKQDWGARRCSVSNQKETDSSEVSIKYSFSIKDTHSEVAYRDSAVDIGEQCEMISDRLLCLEGQLQMAINNHDDNCPQYLQREIQMVKETLQAMLKQLLPLEKGELGDFAINSW